MSINEEKDYGGKLEKDISVGIKFVNGMNWQPVSPNAPETIRGKLYFNWSKFKDFAEKNVNEKGYLNVQMMKSKNTGGIYFILDTFKAKPSAEAREYNDNKYKVENKHLTSDGTDMYNHPFTTDKEREAMDEEDEEVMKNIPF